MRRRLALVWVLWFAGCQLDTSLPEQPKSGRIIGTLDTQGHVPLVGWAVSASSDRGDKLTAATDEAGAFTFSAVPPGLYLVSLSVPGFARLTTDLVRVTNGADADVGTLVPSWLANTPAEGHVEGLVVVPQGGDATGGQIEFLLQPSKTRVAITPVTAGGLFVQRVPPGTYLLHATHPLYVSQDLDGVVVGEGQAVDLTANPISLALNPATVEGTVMQERDGQTAVPAAGAHVTLSLGATTTCDPVGHFTLTGLAAGTQTLRVTAPGFHDPGAGRSVVLEPGKTTTVDPIQVALDRGTVKGIVELADHQPAVDVTVALVGTPYSTGVSASASAPWQGSFQLNGVPVGTYDLSASKTRYSAGSVGGVHLAVDAPVDVGTVTLTLLQGDFAIDDGDANNQAGFTRAAAVTLEFSNFSAAASYRASEDSTFTGVVFSPYTGPNQPFTLGTAQGTHVVYAQYKDAAGTTSQTFSAPIILDSLAPSSPTIAVNAGAAFTNVSNPLVLTLTAQELPGAGVDAVSGVGKMRLSESATVDGAGLLMASSISYQRDHLFVRLGSADGPQTVYAQFIDNAGNASAVVSSSVYIDTQAPTGSIALAQGPKATAPGYTNSPVTTLTEAVGAEPDGGYVLVRVANSQAALNASVFQPSAGSGTWFIDATTDGLKTVYAQLIDAAGNLSTQTLSATITYDSTTPSPAVATLLSPATTNDAGVTLSVTATDLYGLSTTQALTVSEDVLFQAAGTVGPQAMPGTGRVVVPVSAGDGQKTLFVRFRDQAGNDAVTSVKVTLDTTPPTGSFTVTGQLADGTASSTVSFTPSVTVDLTQSGATGYLLGNETLTACPASGYTALAAGLISTSLSGSAVPRQVRLCLVDAAGNTLGPLTQSLSLDTTTPTGCALSLTGKKVDGSAAPAGKTASPGVTAAVAGCSEVPTEFFVSATPVTCTAAASFAWQPYSASSLVSLAGQEGPNTLQGCVRDAAHNTGSLGAGSITLDTTAPQAPSLSLDNGALYVNAAQVTARGGLIASASGAAVAATEWALQQSSDFTAATWTAFPATSPKNVTFPATGLQSLYAAFRDDVGNISLVASAAITLDNTGPSLAGSGVSVVSPTNNGLINSVSATLVLVAPVDATQFWVAQAASTAGCVAGDFASATRRGVVPTTGFLFTAGDGLKLVCAQLFDAAGNPSAIASASVTLDTTPPATPQLQTASTVINLPDNSPFTVKTVVPNAEGDFARYEILGGKLSQWTLGSANIATTSFAFNLVSNGSAAAGLPNVLRLRAVDQAGNPSPEASVVITTDTVAPGAVTITPLGLVNRNSAGTVFWKPNAADTDVVSFNLYYGAASGAYAGTYAFEGNSPVKVSAPAASATLSGLINGSSTFVTVRAVDRAGNEGPAPGFPTELQLQPDLISPTPIVSQSLGLNGSRIAVVGDYAYVLGVSGNCNVAPPTATTAQTVLKVIDLRALQSPVQKGTLNLAVAALPVVTTLTWNDGFSCYSDNVTYYRGPAQPDLLVDGQWAFVASGTRVHMLNVGTPAAPVEPSAALDFTPTVVNSVANAGNVLFVLGEGKTFAVDTVSLYDGNAATAPTLPGSLVGSSTGTASWPALGAVTHDWLVESWYNNASYASALNVANAVDSNGATVFDNTAPKVTVGVGTGPITGFGYTSSKPVASGNLLFMTGVSSNFVVLGLKNLWNWAVAPTPLGLPIAVQTSFFGSGPFEVRGGQVFLPNAGNQLNILDVTNVALSSGAHVDLLSSYVQKSGPSYDGPTAAAVYGPYVLTPTAFGLFQVVEAATPRGLHVVTSTSSGGGHHEVAGGLMYGGDGSVIDLQSSWPPPDMNKAAIDCDVWDGVRVGELLVQPAVSTLRVSDFSKVVDRDATSTFSAAADSYSFALPGVQRSSGIKAWGNYLVVAEVRADGTWVEVFNGKNVRNPKSGLHLSAADSVGAIKVSTYTSSLEEVELTLHHGRAFVSIDEDILGRTVLPKPGFLIVDLRPLMDDSAATPAAILQGSLPIERVRQSAIVGNLAYVNTYDGFGVWDVSAAMDENPATLVTSAAPLAMVPMSAALSVAVYGTYAFVATQDVPNTSVGFQPGTYVIDVSTPAAPVVISSSPIAPGGYGCGSINFPGNVTIQHSGLSVHGSRLYLSGFNQSWVMELE